jgi:CheY-like chemotaxis protein
MTKKRILVVDDEVSLTRMIRLNLETTGRYEVREENRGARAVEAAREFRPHLILLDVMMPDKDGGEVAAEIKDDALLQDTPVVFLTAIVTKEETAPAGSEIAGHTFLAKPVTTEDLIRCIEEQLSSNS